MKPTETDTYMVLLLKGAGKCNIENSWELILRTAYLCSKEILTYFPLPGDLIIPVDRLFNQIIDGIGTDYLGVFYLPDLDEKVLAEFLRHAEYFITDDGRVLKLAIRSKKPCIYFDEEANRYVFIAKADKSHQEFSRKVRFPGMNVYYYGSAHLPDSGPTVTMKAAEGNTKLWDSWSSTGN